MAEETEHPLVGWLRKNKVKAYAFAAKAGMPNFNKIYESISGRVSDPRLSTLQAIEDATEKKVSVQKQSDWFRGRK